MIVKILTHRSKLGATRRFVQVIKMFANTCFFLFFLCEYDSLLKCLFCAFFPSEYASSLRFLFLVFTFCFLFLLSFSLVSVHTFQP